MRSFDALSQRGQGRRLRALAQLALGQYDLRVRRLSLVANHLNAIFRVDTVGAAGADANAVPRGATYALRISHPIWRTAQDLFSELAWLQALARDADLGAPIPVPSRSGALVVEAAAPGVPEPRRCVLFSWLPGPLLADRLTEQHVAALGALSARLHEHATRFVPPPGFTTRRLNGLYVRGELDLLFSDAGIGFFSGEDRDVYVAVAERVHAALASLYADPRGLRVVHGDLHHENAKLDRGRLRPFDFEDVAWGYPVQDLAMTCFDLLDYADPQRTDYPALRAALQRGYASRLPWPETRPGQIDTFIAGRQLWRANWVVRHELQYARRHLAWMAARFRTFLDTGSFPR
jgi:Ser/Thr protein kinase RdoA (MazF antagonist)